VPVTEAGDERPAAAVGRGRLRASRADRERVIELLKAGFVQERLTKEELDSRVGLALASRTYADLAELTADLPAAEIPAEPAAAGPAAAPAGTPARTLARALRRSATCMLVALALVGLVAITGAGLLPVAFFVGVSAVIAASGFLGYGVVDAVHEWRARAQLPPGPSRDGRRPQAGRLGGAGSYPAPPATRTEQTRAEGRVPRPRPQQVDTRPMPGLA
jgi:hypothetical protein